MVRRDPLLGDLNGQLDEKQEQHERERDSDFPDEDDTPFGNRVETKRKLRAVGRDGSEQEFDLFFEHESAGGREFWKYGVQRPGSADWYEGRFRAVGSERVQPDMLQAHGYDRLGITEALFELVVVDARRQCVSSTT